MFLGGVSPWLAVAATGLGNSIYHVGGGSIAINLTPKRASAPGVFVATGALGLFAGMMIGNAGLFSALPFALLLSLAAGSVMLIPQPRMEYRTGSAPELDGLELAMLLVLLAVGVRSFVGLALALPWKADFILAIMLTIAVVSGKALGGFLGDRFGWTKVAVGALALSAPLLAFGSGSAWLAIPGMLLFNMTMPITLTAVSNMLPGRPGFAFGLICLALLAGAVPVYTPLKSLFTGE